MSREIKFRAIFRHTLGGRSVWQFSTVGESHRVPREYHRATSWEQYTGLKDCNGVEIYEGDIVAFDVADSGSDSYKAWWDDESGEMEMPTKKEFHQVTMDRFPVYWLVGERFGYEGEDLAEPTECKVCGNIHENPELLK